MMESPDRNIKFRFPFLETCSKMANYLVTNDPRTSLAPQALGRESRQTLDQEAKVLKTSKARKSEMKVVNESKCHQDSENPPQWK